MNRFFLCASVLILAIFIIPISVEACPGCKNLDDPINKGFNWSILFMMAMPFTVFGLVAGTIFLHWNGYRLSSLWLSARVAVSRRFSAISKEEH